MKTIIFCFFVLLTVATVHGQTPPQTDAAKSNERMRICRQPVLGGICRAGHPRFYYDAVSKQCKKFLYGGCGGNDNRFETEADCIRKCNFMAQRPECPVVAQVDGRPGCFPLYTISEVGCKQINEHCPHVKKPDGCVEKKLQPVTGCRVVEAVPVEGCPQQVIDCVQVVE